jgi:hypothetical protein
MLWRKRSRTNVTPDSGRKQKRKCNLCAREFKPLSPFTRYCHRCREEEELLRFSEWLPETSEAVRARISA